MGFRQSTGFLESCEVLFGGLWRDFTDNFFEINLEVL